MSVQKQFRALARRALLAVGRGIVRLVADDQGLQILQVSLMANEVRSNVERVQNYGMTSVPLPGAEAVAVFVGGNRDHGLVIAVDDRRYRLKGLQGGEVALYTDEGDSVILKRGNNMELNTVTLKITATEQVLVDTPDFRVTGDIIDREATNIHNLESMRSIYDIHVHPENDDAPGPTQPPSILM